MNLKCADEFLMKWLERCKIRSHPFEPPEMILKHVGDVSVIILCWNLHKTHNLSDGWCFRIPQVDVVIRCFCEIPIWECMASRKRKASGSIERETSMVGYRKIYSYTMGMIHLDISVKESFRFKDCVRVHRAKPIPQGFGGCLGNKGFVIAELHVISFKIAVCSAHLSAHKKNRQARLGQLRKLIDELETFSRCDAFVVAGDLNSQQTLPACLVKRCVHLGNLETLMPGDELLETLRTIPVVNSSKTRPWMEPDRVGFLPTYKLNQGGGSYAHNRTPSFTDRIIYSTSKPSIFVPVHYRSIADPTRSDHRPVFATFHVKSDLVCIHRVAFPLLSIA